MNEFLVAESRTLTPQQTVMGVMGISLEQLINDIRENRGGQYDCLYKKKGGQPNAHRSNPHRGADLSSHPDP